MTTLEDFLWIGADHVMIPRPPDIPPDIPGQITVLMKTYPKIEGDFFGGTRSDFLWLFGDKKENLAEIASRLWIVYPERFNLAYDLQNIQETVDNVLFRARKRKDYKTAFDCGDQIWRIRGTLLQKELFHFLDEYFVTSYTLKSPEINIIGKELSECLKKVEVDQKTRERILENLDFLDKKLPQSYRTTIVTAFYEIQKRETSKNVIRRGPQEYLQAAEEKTLSLNLPMVIYCDPEYAEKIQEIRSKIDSPTQIIPQPYEAFENGYLQYRDQVLEAYETGRMVPFRKMAPWKISGHYCFLVWNKLLCCRDTIQRNPFQADRVVWVDFGLAHLLSLNSDLGEHLQEYWDSTIDKIKILQRCYVNQEIVNSEDFFLRDGYNFAGGFFGGSLENMSWLISEFTNQIEGLAKKNLYLLEEQILARIYVEYPERFDLGYGDYQNLLDNLVHPYQNFLHVRDYLMIAARNQNDFKASRRVGEWLWSARERMKANELIGYLDEYLISVNGTEDCPKVAMALIEAMKSCTNKEMIERVRKNLQILGYDLPKVLFELDQKITYITSIVDFSQRDKDPKPFDRSVLEINAPLIIYCETRLLEEMKKIRNREEFTLFIPRELEDWDRGLGYRKRIAPYCQGKISFHSLFFGWTKYQAILEGVKLNPFGTKKFAWIMGPNSSNRVLSDKYIEGDKEKLVWICQQMKKQIKRSVDRLPKGNLHSAEELFTRFVAKHPNEFPNL